MADRLLTTSAILEPAGVAKEYPGMKVKRLYEFLLSTLLSRETLKSKKMRTRWNPIFNCTLGKLDRCDCDGVVGGYSSKRDLVMAYFERDLNAAYSRGHYVMSVHLGGTPVALKLEEGYSNQYYPLSNAVRYLLNAQICPPLAGQKDF